ncbi:hypothetical protein FOZ63_011474, partial [Perkinsus olseni]
VQLKAQHLAAYHVQRSYLSDARVRFQDLTDRLKSATVATMDQRIVTKSGVYRKAWANIIALPGPRSTPRRVMLFRSGLCLYDVAAARGRVTRLPNVGNDFL